MMSQKNLMMRMEWNVMRSGGGAGEKDSLIWGFSARDGTKGVTKLPPLVCEGWKGQERKGKALASTLGRLGRELVNQLFSLPH